MDKFHDKEGLLKWNQLEKLEAAGPYSALLGLTWPYLALLGLTGPY